MLMGNPDAKIRLIEYGSLTCPHCREFDEKGAPQLIEKYVKSGQVGVGIPQLCPRPDRSRRDPGRALQRTPSCSSR